MKQTNLYMDEELKKKLRHLAIEKQTTASKLMRDAVNQVYFNQTQV